MLGARERNLVEDSEKLLSGVETDAARVRTIESTLAGREAAVSAKERDLQRREEDMRRAQEQLEAQRTQLTNELVLLERQKVEVQRQARILHDKAADVDSAAQRLRLREEAMWRLSALAGSKAAVQPMSTILETLNATKASLASMPLGSLQATASN